MFSYGRSIGLDIENILFQDYQGKQKFGLIYLSHVIDDLPRINQVLKNLYSLLHENGLLFIEVPNYEWEKRLRDIKYDDLSVGKYFFTRKTLLSLMTKHDFRSLNLHTFEQIHLNTVFEIITSPFRIYLKFLPSEMRSCLKGIFIKG